MILSVIIPAYNEEKTIEELIGRVKEAPLSLKKEIIVVNDGSSDKTLAILQNIKNKEDFILVSHEENEGKGSAIKTGLNYASGDYVIIQDADLQLDPKDFQALLEPVLKKGAEVVYGSRVLGKNNYKGQNINWPFLLGGMALTSLANLLYGTKITDEAIGYKLFKKEILLNLNLECKGFDFCPEVTAKIAKRGCKIYEVPVSYVPRSRGDGKKVKWKDGFKGIWTLIKYRFK